MDVIFVFIFGLIVGSFLNALLWRLHSGESVLRGRSKCPKCKHVLGATELMPILSFFIRRGKCLHCGKSISWQYPLVELSTAGLFVIAYMILNFSAQGGSAFGGQFLNLLRVWFVISVMIVIFVYDSKYSLILDKIVYPASAVALLTSPMIYGGTISLQSILLTFAAAAVGGGFFLAQYLISGGKWIGGGDIKLGFLMGLILGFPGIMVALFFSYVIGAAVSLGLVAARRKTMKSQIPFGTFLAIGTVIALFWGEKIFDWYLKY